MGAPSTQVIPLLRRAIEEGDDGRPGSFNAWHEYARMALRMAFGEGDNYLVRFDAISYSLHAWSESTPQSAWDRARVGGVKEAIALLSAALAEVEHVAGQAPAVDLAGLHPWVSGTATSLWDIGNHRQAVAEAARTVEVQLKAKLELADGTGSRLVSDAFSKEPPKPGRPRLRFPRFQEDTQPWRDAHIGAGSFGQGCYMRIRNLLAHGEETSPQEALESLAALSLLARWIDDAVVDRRDMA
jgi:hypothetical protein